jgi:hypothetical protein
MLRWVKENYPLLIALLFFVFIHTLNFHFYHYIPEGDGYLDMVRIDNTVETGRVSTTYRTLFNTSMSLIVAFGNISSYRLFSFWIIFLESSVIISLYLLIKKYEIKDSFFQLLILLSALSIPVLNMEIDYVRPQTLLIILFPIYLYFLSLALQTKKSECWILPTTIAFIGIGYHQFFLFIFVAHVFIIFLYLLKLFSRSDKRNKLSFILGGVIFFLLLSNLYFVFLKNNQTYQENSYYFNTIVTAVKNMHWRWWFLNNYPVEAQPTLPMGWSGTSGAIKFYSYYIGPITASLLLLLLYFIYKEKSIKFDKLIQFCFPLFLFFLFFAEILPRFNRPLIPERFWLPIDILLLFLSVPLWKKLLHIIKKQIIYIFIIFIVITGIAGSFYVAYGKNNSIVSENDIESAGWIRSHTETDAIFLSQASNDALFAYFFKREMITNIPKEEWVDTNIKENYKKTLDAIEENIILPSCPINMNRVQIDECIRKLKSFASDYDTSQEERSDIENKLSSPLYIYYSEDRFNNIFSQREWWRIKNYANIDLEKLNKLYTLVYNKNGVHIWKVN